MPNNVWIVCVMHTNKTSPFLLSSRYGEVAYHVVPELSVRGQR